MANAAPAPLTADEEIDLHEHLKLCGGLYLGGNSVGPPPGGSRGTLARGFVEPGYKRVPLNVRELRNLFAEFLKISQTYGEVAIKRAGSNAEEPRNPHLANIWHTQMLVHLDQAKDAFIKWILASAGEREPREHVDPDKWASTLFEHSAKRKRVAEPEPAEPGPGPEPAP